VFGTNVFNGCEKLTNASANALLQKVSSIGNNAFQGCKELTEIKIGNVRPFSIGTNTFTSCSKLKIIEFLDPTVPTSVGNNALGV